MSAQPAESHVGLLDPRRILRDLPEQEQDEFLAQYRDAISLASDPAGWDDLQRTLRLWSMHAEAMKQPGYWDARDSARAAAAGGMLLEDAERIYRHSA